MCQKNCRGDCMEVWREKMTCRWRFLFCRPTQSANAVKSPSPSKISTRGPRGPSPSPTIARERSLDCEKAPSESSSSSPSPYFSLESACCTWVKPPRQCNTAWPTTKCTLAPPWINKARVAVTVLSVWAVNIIGRKDKSLGLADFESLQTFAHHSLGVRVWRQSKCFNLEELGRARVVRLTLSYISREKAPHQHVKLCPYR